MVVKCDGGGRCGVFTRENGSLLKYNRSSPSLSVISVQLDKEIILKWIFVILTSYKGSSVSLENIIDSNRRIIHDIIPDLVSEIACTICSKTKENQSIIKICLRRCRIDKKLLYWFLT